MAETIESFVAKLQAEGVQAGQQEGQRLRQQAQQEADEIIRRARQEAEKIAADAKTQADQTRARAATELQLAARDAVLRAQSALSRILSAVLACDVRKCLEDNDFLGRLLHDIVMLYVQADCQRTGAIKINVEPDMRQKLVDWAFREVGREAVEKVRPSIDLKGTLADAGFEYTVDGATIEVTCESVVETLMDLVGPSLREVIQKAMSAPQG